MQATPPTLTELLSIDRNPRAEFAVDKLTTEQCEKLKEIVKRKDAPSETFSMSKAITALVRCDPSPEVSRILGRFLADERQSTTDRSIAAINLRLIPGPETQEELMSNLQVSDHYVQLEVIQSLGTFGDEEALKALEKLSEPTFEWGRKQLAFAKALIAHRLGLSGKHLPFKKGVERERGKDDEMIALTLQPLLKPTVRSHRQFLLGSAYGIEVGDIGFELTAGKLKWTVFVNHALGGGERYGKLFQRKWVAALLALWDPQTHTASVQHVVLTDVQNNWVEIMVVRTDGEVFYTGEITRSEDFMTFSMRDVVRSATAPTKVAGRLTLEGVELIVSIPFGRRINSHAGEPVAVLP